MRGTRRGCIVDRNKDPKRKPNYSLKISLGKNPTTGKYQYKWVAIGSSKRDAEKRLSEVLNQLDTGNYMEPGKSTLAEYLDRWINEYVYPNLSPSTAEGYEGIANRYFIPRFGSIKLVNLKPQHLQKLYSQEIERGLSPQTVRNQHNMIHKALQDAVEWGILIRNVADAVKPPRLKGHEMQTWNVDEVMQFLDVAKNTPYYYIFYFALFTGLRRSEFLALRWEDVDLILGQIYVNRSVHVLKGGKVQFRPPKTATGRRPVALTPSTVLTLNEYRREKEAEAILLDQSISESDLLFSGLEGKPLLPNTISHAWVRLVNRTDIKKIRLHDARHTHASLMLKQGIHPKIVQERLGHSSIQITLDTYSHVAPGLQAAAAKSFDKAFDKNYNEENVGEAQKR
ncbi:tyrosine-type recombinase/integrase [Chloroflexota bacterium]